MDLRSFLILSYFHLFISINSSALSRTAVNVVTIKSIESKENLIPPNSIIDGQIKITKQNIVSGFNFCSSLEAMLQNSLQLSSCKSWSQKLLPLCISLSKTFQRKVRMWCCLHITETKQKTQHCVGWDQKKDLNRFAKHEHKLTMSSWLHIEAQALIQYRWPHEHLHSWPKPCWDSTLNSRPWRHLWHDKFTPKTRAIIGTTSLLSNMNMKQIETWWLQPWDRPEVAQPQQEAKIETDGMWRQGLHHSNFKVVHVITVFFPHGAHQCSKAHIPDPNQTIRGSLCELADTRLDRKTFVGDIKRIIARLKSNIICRKNLCEPSKYRAIHGLLEQSPWEGFFAFHRWNGEQWNCPSALGIGLQFASTDANLKEVQMRSTSGRPQSLVPKRWIRG